MYITNIKLKDVRCFKEVNINLAKGKGAKSWLLVVGNNGVGKTSFLSSLAMGLCDETGAFSLLQDTSGDFIRKGAKSATIKIQLVNEGKTYTITTSIVKSKSGDFEVIKRSKGTSKDIPWKEIFVCGYGSNRSIEGDRVQEKYSAADALYTLFNYKFSLLNPELMLRRRAKTDTEIEEICKWLDDILLLDEGSIILTDFGIAIRYSKYDIHWGSIADSYEATITMILDMLGWALLSGQTEKKNILQGIMLIDELEQHLHPELQRFIVEKLHDIFPNIQFIASSHSPICAAGLADLSDEECDLELLTFTKDGLVTNEPQSTMRGWRYDEVLTSHAFSIPSRNVKTEVLMNKIHTLYMKKKLTDNEDRELKILLEDLNNMSAIGREAAERRRILAELDCMKKKLKMKEGKGD